MDGPTIGSLFTGAGALCELAVAPLLGGRVIWHCEYEPPTEKKPRPTQAAARMLAHRFPDTPNLGDISRVDWAAVPRPDILTGGFPCTDVSLAGAQAGLRPETRSGTWTYMAHGIRVLRPDMVVIENVRGLASTGAHCDVEPCPWCVGDQSTRPVLRAFGAVLGDLADLGYDAWWTGLPASDVGACHARFRFVVVAAPRDSALFGWDPALVAGECGEPAWATGGSDRVTPAYPDSAGHAGSPGTELRITARPAIGRDDPEPLLPTPRATDGTKGEPNQRGSSGDLMLPSVVAQLLPTPAVADSQGTRATRGGDRGGELLRGVADQVAATGYDWGIWEAAIRRHERWLGRPVPEPRVRGARGGWKLNPALSEWMMGWPAGWVTDVPGLTIDEQLQVCGNGVVPQQIQKALSYLIPMVR